ncbi:Cyclin-A2-2, partial [Glycine soja]
LQRKPLTNYMEKLQKDINPSMRRILVDWLVECDDYKVKQEQIPLLTSHVPPSSTAH